MNIDEDDDSGSSVSGDTGPGDADSFGVPRVQWIDRLRKIDISKRIMDKIVLNYFVVEGHHEAAEAFQKESGIENNDIVRSMGERVAIVSLIKAGELTKAIDQLNELDYQILDTNEGLCFQLKCQQLIELIRCGDLQNALIFAQQNLAPRALSNAEFLKNVEDIMSLFVFEDVHNCPLSRLVSQAHRNNLANLVNVAVLERFGKSKESVLLGLTRRLAWSESRLNHLIPFPTLSDIFNEPCDERCDQICDRMEQDYSC